MAKNNTPTHVFKHDGVDYVLTEVFGSAVMHNEEDDTYCIDKEQMGKMIEHIRQQMGIASCFQARADILNSKLADMRSEIIQLSKQKDTDDYRDNTEYEDKALEYYRKHPEEVKSFIRKYGVAVMYPKYTTKRGEFTDPIEVQDTFKIYEDRIDELTKQCNNVYTEKLDAVRERDKALAELTDYQDRLSLKHDEVDLLNILRGYNACAIIIKKENGHDRWSAEYLVQKKS